MAIAKHFALHANAIKKMKKYVGKLFRKNPKIKGV